MSELYRLVYASKNLFQGSEAELTAAVGQILASSQRNNARSDVTGALMFNSGAFAQVLEGPRQGVEETFERIQCDDRHGDVTVLQCGPTESRSFASWSMAFVGASTGGQARFSRLAAESGFDLSRLDGDAVFTMLHELVLEEEGVPLALAAASPIKPAQVHPPAGLDVEQLKAEIAELQPAALATRASSSVSHQRTAEVEGGGPQSRPIRDVTLSPKRATDAALCVLKAALVSERQRTSDLRTEIDTLQVALASSEDQLAAMRAERDRWAGRAQLLATAMAQEAGTTQISAHRVGSFETSSNGQASLKDDANVLAA
ncbi:BLUF domain-containing protein [Methylobacterium sp. J-077]|uniref:BLUF domain-containing protein n=1 Tax=Methylobacterium sp. J-077 TaxID=2836656 RepID=UPI001FB8C80B|nr:BLUF domain-containing protein [Methylobacterium sp. J-077]MCJ2124466.1 BLUF domain-containing protein [Methylobacterium sp. J-077]